VAYPDLAAHLRPFNVNVALLPIGPNGFSVSEAAELAEEIGAAWLVPMHYGTFLEDSTGEEDREGEFVMHMLGHRPEQRFQVFQVGERWTVPEE
jgi:L-ascorbate metabolism protein UlaG (beta-lactamase superfamily)